MAGAQVCQLLSKNAWLQVKEMKKASTPANPVSLAACMPCGSCRDAGRHPCCRNLTPRLAPMQVDENKVIERMEKITTGE